MQPTIPPILPYNGRATVKEVRSMKKLIMLLVLVAIGLVIAKQFAGNEN